MLLQAIHDEPFRSLRYMERRVNDGSPSGFTNRYTTSPETSPFGDTESFPLYLALAPPDYFETFGDIPNWPSEPFSRDGSWMLVHPDMAGHQELDVPNVSVYRQDRYQVVPTASGRTVQYLNAPEAHYVKLHYAGILGRVSRRLPYKAAISGPEVSALLAAATTRGTLHPLLTFLPETGGRVLRLATSSGPREWGMTWRASRPYGPLGASIAAMVPAFSLFSKDQHAEFDPPLICQLIESSGVDARAYALDHIILPMVTAYFAMIRDLGLQPEWNAQNLLIGLDARAHVIAFVMRDLESIDKDLTLRRQLGLECEFKSCPHKCIHDGQYNYQIKHSFMFDYKFGGYIIEPLLQLIAERYALSYADMVGVVRTVTDNCLRSLPDDFFPDDGCWYRFESVLVDQTKPSRPYVNPHYS